jgi:site-specific recombinase XerD
MDIIERYANLHRMSADSRLFQMISNQKLNAYLKELADVCGIEKNLTFHVARHTFATTVILQNGVSVEALSRMMGHRDIKTTQHYARIVDRKLADEMRGMSDRTNLELAS